MNVSSLKIVQRHWVRLLAVRFCDYSLCGTNMFSTLPNWLWLRLSCYIQSITVAFSQAFKINTWILEYYLHIWFSALETVGRASW